MALADREAAEMAIQLEVMERREGIAQLISSHVHQRLRPQKEMEVINKTYWGKDLNHSTARRAFAYMQLIRV